jgi:hypothetical protein
MLRSTNAMRVDYLENESLTFKIVGGIIDLKFIIGGTNAADVVK